MKKIYFLVTTLLLITGYAAKSQCTNGSAFGTITAPTNNVVTTITTCAFGGEYSTINGCTAGQQYTFNVPSGTANYITIHQGTPSGAVLGFGTAPVTVTCTVSGPLYLHYNTNAACGTSGSCNTGTVQCITCPAPADPCTSIVNIPACATPVTTVHSGSGVWSVTACGFSTPGQERIYSFTPATTGVYSLNVTAVGPSGFLDYYWKLQSAGCGPTGWTCIDDNAGVGTDPIGLLTAGVPIYILVDDESTAATTHTFNISCGAVAPANDLCSGALALPCGGSVSGTTVGATIDAVGTCGTSLGTAPGVWYTFVGNGGPNTLSTCTGTTYDSKIGVFSGSCGGLICVAGNDDFCGLQSSVTFNANAGTTYYVLVTGFGSATGAFTLTRTVAPLPNDVCTGAVTINCGQTITGSTACGATTDAATPICGTTLNTSPGVWYQFAGDGSPVTLSLCGSSFDTKIGVFTGTCAALTCVTGNDDFCGLQSQVTFNTNAGFTYYILVTGFGSATGNFTLTRTCAPPCSGVPSPGAITVSPAASAVCQGTAMTLTCSGYSPNSALTFQWSSAPAAAGPYTPIAGAVSNVYTFNATVTTYYRCTVTCTNGSGNATTAPVVVTVDGISHINVSATPSAVCAPGTAAITGTAINGILGASSGIIGNSGTINLPIVDNGTITSTINLAPVSIPNPAALRIRINATHTWVGDLTFQLTSPCGTTYLFDRPGLNPPGTCCGSSSDLQAGGYTFDVAAATAFPEAPANPVPLGTYRPTDAFGVANPTWAAMTFPPCAGGGAWTLSVSDGAGGDVGTLIDWQIIGPIPNAYTHTLTGPGTIVQNPSTGPNNATGNFTVSNVPAGVQNFVLTSTDPFGCSVSSNVTLTVHPLPTIVITAGTPTTSTISYTGPAVAVPDNTPAGVDIPLAVSGLTGNISDLNFRLDAGAGTCDATTGNTNASMDHTFNGDLVFRLTSPLGTSVVLINRRGGGGNNFCTVLLDDDGGFPASSTMTTAGAISGNFAPENPLSAFDGQNPNGTWTLNVSDNAGIDVGSLRRFSLIFSTSSPNATICNGQIVPINAYATPGSPQTFNSSCVVNIPGSGTVGNGSPYPCVLSVGGLPPAGVTVQSVRINNYNHTFPDDVDLVLVSPTGTSVILMSDAGGATPATGQIFTFSDGAASLLADNAFNPTGTYRPTNYLTPDNFPAPGPGSLTQAAPALSSFTGNPNGNWSLYAVDDLTGSTGIIGGWSITFGIPAPVVFSPTTNLFTDAAATTPYTGTPVYTVWAAPTVTTTYTATATIAGCTNTATSVITVNQLPAITAQPTPATQTICPGFTVSYSVAATGAGLSYQWQFNPGSGFVNLVNGGFISGATSTTLTIANVQAANAGSYRVVVSGTCAPPATSNSVVLNVGSAPTISTQPANATVCEGSNGTFSVVAAGTPTPTIFQWQVSTDGGVTWTNLTTGGSYTATLTLTNVTLAMNGNRYRVIITNSCGMTITSNVVTLTVNPRPVIAITPLPTRICLSDTLVPLVASPTGGSWTGIGVSGFNFVPTATAVGTYPLTYTFTSAAGCTNTASVVAKVESCPERIRLLSNDGVILFPNPNNGRFNIRINSTLYNYLGMKVYDMAGRLMNGKVVKNGTDQALVSPTYTGLVYGRVIPIDLSNLAAGTYLVKFYYDDGIRSSEKGFLVVIQK